MYTDPQTTELTTQDCWDMLRTEKFGRLAFRLVDEVHILPVNYVVDGESLLFRTAQGSKLLSVALGSQVAFEIDRRGERTAQSVVLRGSAELLSEEAAHVIDELPLTPWVQPATPKQHVVRILPEVLTGRRFELDRGAVEA